MRDRIPIKKNLIPYGFDIVLGATKYNLMFMYNRTSDLFTVRLKIGNEIICQAEPLIYGIPLFQDIYISGKFPCMQIEPLDESGADQEVTWNNFTETVFLTINNGK